MMALKIDKQRQKKVLIEQKELDVPEVKKVEYLLGWKIEAVKREYMVPVRDGGADTDVLTVPQTCSDDDMESFHANRSE
jgi:hypothetical protein